MPGGRLTRQDRSRIADGLTQGLGYAEIARGLARPTSTISREVHRNGGPHTYLAEQADQATQRRARHRERPAIRPSLVTAARGRDAQAMSDAEARLVAMAVQTGLPRMMAKVLFALLVSETGALAAAELARRLRVSPASISRAVRSLEHLGFVHREHELRPRRERYVLQDHTWPRIWVSQALSVQRWAAEVEHSAEVFGSGTPTGLRLSEIGRFLDLVHTHMVEVTERWRRLMAAPDDRASGEGPPIP